MTFAPNITQEHNFINDDDLTYMPTYESEKNVKGTETPYPLQIFISEDHINSMFSSYTRNGVINMLLSPNRTDFIGASCYEIASYAFKIPGPAKNCIINFFLGKH
jgi:hypothetical protein